MSVQGTSFDFYLGVLTVGFGMVYLISLLRANWVTWTNILVMGIAVDIALRSIDTYSPTTTGSVVIAAGESATRLPWIFFQGLLCVLTIVLSIQARLSTKREVYRPGVLTIWGGLAFGGFVSLELTFLGMPGVLARWTGGEFTGIAPWLILITCLPLVPSIRISVRRLFDLFDERLKGWVWFFLLLLLIVIGTRIEGSPGATALLGAQFVAVLTVWWIPGLEEAERLDQTGPAQGIATGVLVIAMLVFGLTFLPIRPIYGQSLIVVLICASLLAFQRLWWRESDPWQVRGEVPNIAFVSFALGLTLLTTVIVVAAGPRPVTARGATLRVATYDVNGGYDSSDSFRLELIARTIEASVADVVILHNVDVGLPQGFGIDQVEFLSRRLDMTSRYYGANDDLAGVAVLSRWQIASHSTVTLDGGDFPVSVLRVIIEDRVSGRSASIVSVGILPDPGHNALEISPLLGLLVDNRPLIVGSNLGLVKGQVYNQLVAAGLSDPDAVLGIEQGFTYPSTNPTERLDFILTRGFIPIDSRQVDSTASTHRLVVVEVGWP
jgi:endonuclease/exonuclease/phosphatase family metal-dependent hydrolase